MSFPTPARPLREETIALKVVLAICLALLAVSVGVGIVYDGVLIKLLDDPSEGGAENYPSYYGAISYCGVAGWTVGAALALFAASIAGARSAVGRFLACAGAFTVLLALDDLFRLHEHVGFALPLGEQLILLAYGVLALAMVWASRDVILRDTPVAVLGLAALLLGGSGFIDATHLNVPKAFFVEDALKFLGIFVWAAYLGMVARRVCLGGGPLRPSEAAGPGATPSAPVPRQRRLSRDPHARPAPNPRGAPSP
ncbi:MAG: hypothetical protein ACR2NH_12515 [Solirubrobacteraceae bacterium]